ncbi:MAG: MBL fold metallo-hydrolase [Nitrososphaeria archaeon]
MRLKFLGGTRQVGKSGVLLSGEKTSLLLDYGVMLSREEPGFPIHVQPKLVNGVILTHAHLDHSGAIPLIYIDESIPLVTTNLTFELTELLIEDFINLSGFYLPYEYIDLLNTRKNLNPISFNKKVNLKDASISFKEGGHLPGAGIALIEIDGKRVVYTGDINARKTSLLRGADIDLGEVDILITESTYALQEHPNREKVEKSFVEYAREIVEGGGTLLAPAFAVGRAQEIAMVLYKEKFNHDVYMDGMALKTNEILLRHGDYVRDIQLFAKTLNWLKRVEGWKDRKRIVKDRCVIISPAGMLVGGAAAFYNEKISENPKNGISFVSYQVKGTPGRQLLESKISLINGKPQKVKAEVRNFNFSSHSGRSELFDMIKRIKGSPKVFTMHGEEENCVNFAKDIKEKFGLDAVAPKAGGEYEL